MLKSLIWIKDDLNMCLYKWGQSSLHKRTLWGCIRSNHNF